MRGGKRLGSGRPISEDKKVMVAMRLPAHIVEWMRQQPVSQASIVEHAIVQTYGLQPCERNEHK